MGNPVESNSQPIPAITDFTVENILTFLLILTFPQFVSAIEIPGSSALAALIVSHFDNNADGTLDPGEWQAGMENGFAEIDNDGSGSVAAGELRELAGPLGDEIGEFAAQSGFRRVALARETVASACVVYSITRLGRKYPRRLYSPPSIPADAKYAFASAGFFFTQA